MVTVLLMTLFLGLLSVGLWAYTRILLTSAAADAARYAANANVSDQVAGSKAAQYLGSGIVASTKGSLSCRSGRDGLLVSITCTMTAPGLLGFLDGVLPDITVTGHSIKEGRVSRLLRRLAAARRPAPVGERDGGRAVIEVVILGVLVLIPTIYLLIGVLRVQAATLAVNQAARDAGRAMGCGTDTGGRFDPGPGDRRHRPVRPARSRRRGHGLGGGGRRRLRRTAGATLADPRCHLRHLRGRAAGPARGAVRGHRHPQHRHGDLHRARR